MISDVETQEVRGTALRLSGEAAVCGRCSFRGAGNCGKTGREGAGWTGDHLVATSNLSLTRLTLQALAPCFFLSVSQSSDVSKRGMGGFLEPELWPGSGA